MVLRLNIPVLKGLHFVMKRVFEKKGFTWEVRRLGDLKVGLWRKVFVSEEKKTALPGRRKRLVIVPGLGDTPLSWYIVILILWGVIRKQFDELILVDFPGFAGFLREEPAFHDFALFVRTTDELLASLNPHTLIGHSLGGWTVGSYVIHAGKNSDKLSLKRLVLVAPSGVCLKRQEIYDWKALFYKIEDHGFEAIRPYVCKREPVWIPLIFSEIRTFFDQKEIVQFIKSIRARDFLSRHVHQIQAKTWVIWGDEDELVPSRWMNDWMTLLPEKAEAKGVYLHDCGHSPHLEKSVTTAAIIGRILSKRELHEGALGMPKGSWSYFDPTSAKRD